MTTWTASGVLRMVRFNWPDFVAAGGVVAAALLALLVDAIPGALVAPVVAAGSLAGWWLGASLGAGWWVYDHSSLYDWRWVTTILRRRPRRWLNVTVGFDESSDRLRAILGVDGTTVDVFDAERMTEASIRRARASRSPVAGTLRCPLGCLPFADGRFDAIFVIFAAHELRERADREALFRELARVVGPGGTVALVEHPRNAANLLAFGPGALHFLPRTEWVELAESVGLEVARTTSMTPLVEAIAFERAP